MESIAENLIVFTKRRCSSCEVEKSEGYFIKCSCVGAFWKTCLLCRESKTKDRDKVRASASASSSTAPTDYYEMVFSHPPGATEPAP